MISWQANFVKWKVVTVACFFLMCLTWLATRLYILPFVILGSILRQGKFLMEFTPFTPVTFLAIHTMFILLLGLLVLLHIVWFLMFVKMLFVFAVKKECHDLSEHKSGEQQYGHGANQENHGKKDK